jgi:Holliday junction resolvase-like predicted endonuclease
MAREPFYEVAKEVYLFPSHSLIEGERNNPEEPVRQRTAFELIRAYGIPVANLTFEHPVKVGSKNYRIDILVSRGGKPWVVVECKERSHQKADAGMAQAISYASAQTIQAEFAVYTNGDVWQVKRRIRDEWVAVPDLPMPVGDEHGHSITEWLDAIHAVAPLLHKVHEPIEGEDALKFLQAMQTFFCGRNLLNRRDDQNLQSATDHVLRVLSTPDTDDLYARSKLEVARRAFDRFRARHAYPIEICPVGGETIRFEIRELYNVLRSMIDGTKDLATSNALLLRLNVAILEYGQNRETPSKCYPPIGRTLHQSLHEYLKYMLAARLNLTLPDPLDEPAVSDLRNSCHFAWQ